MGNKLCKVNVCVTAYGFLSLAPQYTRPFLIFFNFKTFLYSRYAPSDILIILFMYGMSPSSWNKTAVRAEILRFYQAVSSARSSTWDIVGALKIFVEWVTLRILEKN